MIAYLIILMLVLAIIYQAKRIMDLERMVISKSTKLGKAVEQLVPLSDEYPFNPSNFRFIGSPVDGVQFEEDRIVFVEFKTGKSPLSKRQKRIKEIVESGNVGFMVIRK